MTKRLTFLLLVSSVLILSFTPTKPVKNPSIKKSTPACATTFSIELWRCDLAPNFTLDYITVNGIQLDMNVGCPNAGPTYVGSMAFANGPATITIHASVGKVRFVDLWDSRGPFDGWLGGYFGNGTNTLTFSTDLQGCGEHYTIRVRGDK